MYGQNLSTLDVVLAQTVAPTSAGPDLFGEISPPERPFSPLKTRTENGGLLLQRLLPRREVRRMSTR